MTPSVSSAATAPLPTLVLDGSPARPKSLVATVAGDLIGAAARELATGAARALAVAVTSGGTSAAKLARARALGAGYASATSSAAKASTTKKTTTTTKKTSTSKTTSSKAKASDPYAFLRDPSLSIEDKLMRVLAQLNQQYETEMQQHLQRLSGQAPAATATKSSGTSSSKKSGGILGGLVSAVADVVKTAVPGIGAVANILGDKTVQSILKSVGGPVLGAAATALGFPEVAPLLVKYGPQIADVVGKVAKEIDSPAKSSGSSSSGSSSGSTGTTGTALSQGDTQLELMQLQRLQDNQKNMFQLASNIFRSLHDTRAAIIGNIR